MLKFEPKSERKEGVWSQYQGDVGGKIRPLDKKILRELRKKATVTDRRTGFRNAGVVEKVDPDLLEDLIICHVFEDWAGVVDTEGRPIPCTDEMKLDVADKFIDFTNWAIDEARNVAEHYEERKAAALKNSSFTPPGSGRGPEA